VQPAALVADHHIAPPKSLAGPALSAAKRNPRSRDAPPGSQCIHAVGLLVSDSIPPKNIWHFRQWNESSRVRTSVGRAGPCHIGDM
jgi:hypothetical protein